MEQPIPASSSLAMIQVTFSLPQLARHAAAVAALWLMTGATAHAAEAPPYADLLRQSLAIAPTMAAQAATVRAAGADAAQARAWLNPRIDTMVENLGAPASDGVSQRQNTYTLSLPLEIGGKRGARIAVGEWNFAAAQGARIGEPKSCQR
ncbi:TolC family protein [Ralstonia mannitolilytica]|uniref:TolC family protein n=1 Tax=Ralstonia mannitolilytica TaxID=105219 RepID=UPI0023E3D2F7|nr:TolC family protein [Ralstonia mannitolilytica]